MGPQSLPVVRVDIVRLVLRSAGWLLIKFVGLMVQHGSVPPESSGCKGSSVGSVTT